MKTSKILKKTGNGTWNTKQGETMYAWELEMENGDVGTDNTKDPDGKNLPEGETIDYNITESDKGNKIQKVYVPGQKSASNDTSLDPTRQESIERQSTLKSAVEYTNGTQGKTPEHVIEVAKTFLKWIQNK